MAIVTTTGSLSSLLQTTTGTLANAANALASHLNHFTSSFNQASDQIFSDFFQDVGSTPSLLKARLYYPSNVYIDIAGSGFAGYSGSVRKIDYKASPLSWTLEGSGSWSYSRGLSSLTIKNLEMRNAAGTEKFVLTGSINAFSGAGSLKSSTLLYNGFSIEQTGNFKLDGQTGSYSAISYSDAQGKVSITGKIAQNTVVITEQLGDLFDNPNLFKGNDTFNVSDNSRAWYAFAGNDTMNGGALADELHGGDGNDKLYGNAGDDRLFGGAGNDLLDGGQGDDYLEGGLGNDTYTDMNGDNVILDTGGNNKITTGAGNDEISTGSGNDTINAGDGNNFIFASGGNNKITAGAGHDEIVTGDGKDIINAGAGDDFINAGGGANKVTGGAGADTFVFSQLGRGHITTLLDFNAAEGDTLRFDGSVFTALAGIEDLSNHLVVGAKARALDADDFLIYDSKSKKLYYDADGAGGEAAIQIAVLKGVGDLSAGDLSVMNIWPFA